MNIYRKLSLQMDIDERCRHCLVSGFLYYCYRCKHFYCHTHIPFHIYAATCSQCRKKVCLDFYKHRKCIECEVDNIASDLKHLSLPQTDTLTPLFSQLKMF